MTVTERWRAEREHMLQQERELSERLHREHAGEWVAVRGHEVIATADTPESLYEQLASEAEPYRSFRVTNADGVAVRGFRRV